MFKLWPLLFGLLMVPAVGAPVLGDEAARHLLNRTGFSATPAEIREYSPLSRDKAVEKILAQAGGAAATPAPSWVNDDIERPGMVKNLSEEDRKAFQQMERERSLALRGWWYQEMLTTRSPLTERMTLFWHNHFVSSQQKVKSPILMYRQNVTLRRYALGNFGELLHAAAKDPAMLIYLDSVSNRQGEPNENFAREVMELFTLGEGHYSEQDVKEAARAYTGWSLDRATGQYMFRPRLHDDGMKSVLGHQGNFDGDQVLDILLAQPATAEFITGKLWKEFVSPDPDPVLVKKWAKLFRDRHYEIKPLLQVMLSSDVFFASRGKLIKSPVELVVGTLHQFNVDPGDWRGLVLVARNLGQDVFAPPNVKGWPGGEDWINSASLLGRKQFLDRLFRESGAPPPVRPADMADMDKTQRQMLRAQNQIDRLSVDTVRWLAQFGQDTVNHQMGAELTLLAINPQTDPEQEGDGVKLIRQLVLDPAYQLK